MSQLRLNRVQGLGDMTARPRHTGFRVIGEQIAETFPCVCVLWIQLYGLAICLLGFVMPA